MQMSMKLYAVQNSTYELRLLQKELNVCGQRLACIRHDLYSLSDIDKTLDKIRQCERQIEEQSEYCMLFGNTLDQICRLYEKNENELIGYSEDVKRKAVRTAFAMNSLAGLYPIFYKIICIGERRRLS